jgi:hypothetical protein
MTKKKGVGVGNRDIVTTQKEMFGVEKGGRGEMSTGADDFQIFPGRIPRRHGFFTELLLDYSESESS